MSSALASALGRCAWRRAQPLLAANPLVAALAVALAVATPVLAVLAGRRLGAELGPAVARDDGVAVALAVGPALTAAAAGALASLVAPGAAFLGDQLRTAPITAAEAFVWLTLAPLAIAAALALLAGACLLVPIAAATPGGAPAAAPALLGGLAAGALGAALAEAGLGAARGSPAAAAVGVAAAAVWGLGALAAGDPVAGPLRAAADALRGEAGSVPSAVVTAALAAVAAGLWTLAAFRRPPERPASARVRALLPVRGGPYAASALVAVKRLGRRRELRRAVAATGIGAAACAALLAQGLGAEPEAGFVLAAGAALLGCAAIPVAAYGAGREGSWLSDASPAWRGGCEVAAATAALLLAFGVLALELAAVWAVAPAPLRQAAVALGAACVVFGAGLATGRLVPWRSDRLVDQLVAFTALAALTLALWLALGELVRVLAAFGLPRAAATGVALALPPLLGLAACSAPALRRTRR